MVATITTVICVLIAVVLGAYAVIKTVESYKNEKMYKEQREFFKYIEEQMKGWT